MEQKKHMEQTKHTEQAEQTKKKKHAEQTEQAHWHQRQLRILQTVMREPDLLDYNEKQVVQYLKQTGSNAIVVNAGGLIDFFPNQEPLGRRNRFMSETDALGSLIKACHGEGIAVIARVDFRGVEDRRYEMQPDWFAQDEKGKSKLGWNGQLHKPCYNGIYANDHAVRYIRQMLADYEFDGVWENSVGFGDGPCYCHKCRIKYRRDAGKEIPEGGAYESDLFAEYRRWKEACAREHLQRMRNAVKEFGEDKAYCAEIFGMFHASQAVRTGIDLYQAKDLFDFLVSPAFLDGSAQPDRNYDELIYAASSMKFLKAISGKKQVVMLYGNNGTKWRYVMAPRQETRIWLWEAVSTGAGIWNCLFNGQHPNAAFDRRNAYLECDAYDYLKQHEDALSDLVPQADAGIYYSKDSRDRFGHDKEELDDYGVFIKGAERALTQNHVQYAFVPDLDFSYEAISHLDALILANAACLSDAQISIIKEYVRNGGGLIASSQTSLYDENGRCRSDFGLKDLFGCSFTGITKDTSSDSYQKIRTRHPILDLIKADQTELLMNGGKTLLCKVERSRNLKSNSNVKNSCSLKSNSNVKNSCSLKSNSNPEMVCSYVPMIYNQPPEFSWLPDMDAEYPTILAGRYGNGRFVYFANQIDKLCYTNGHEDFLNLYTKALEWVKTKKFLVRTNAPESVHITLMAKRNHENQMVLSIVNTTSATARPVRDLVPVSNVWIELTGITKEISTWKLLYGESGVSAALSTENEKPALRFEFPHIKEFAAIALES